MGNGIKPTVHSHFTLGDMAAYYMLEKEDNQIELLLLPTQKEKELIEKLDAMLDSKCLHGDSLIQVKLLDDIYPGAYGPGTSMRNSGTVDECRFEKQEKKLTEKLDAMLESKCLHGDSLIQVKLLDDMYPGAYGPGTSMRNSGTVDKCRFEKIF